MATEPDPAFSDPRLAVLYDVFEDDRDDLEVYAAIAVEFAARTVIDVGCGTGELAVRLGRRGFEVIGVDPAAASLDVARTKDGADRVTWIDGPAVDLADRDPVVTADLAVMTGNVAQVFVDDEDWNATIRAVASALRPGGRFVFETRRPEVRAWEAWTSDETYERTTLPSGEVVETWGDLLDVSDDPLTVSFRWTYVFDPDGPEPETRTSESTLRFRDLGEIVNDLAAAGFTVAEVRDAPDRPGREWVVVAVRGESPAIRPRPGGR